VDEIEAASSRECLAHNVFRAQPDRLGAPRRRLAGELAGVIEAARGDALAQLHPERREGKLRHAYWHCLIRAHKPE